MSQKQKDERRRRKEKCVLAGSNRLRALRDGNLSASDIEEMRSSILSGDCPLCGESGYKNIALHCQQMHGIASRELRDSFGMTYTQTICSQDLHEKLSKIHAGTNPQSKVKPSGKRKYSKLGEQIRQSNLAPAPTWVSKDILRANGRKAGRARKGVAPWNKTSTHGTRAMFRQGCRCDLCLFAMKEYNKNLNLSRKNKREEAAQA